MFHGVTRAEYPGIRDNLWPVAKRLQDQGKLRFIGLTEPMPGAARPKGSGDEGNDGDGHEVVTWAARDNLWDAVMLKYGVIDQSAARTALPAAAAANMGVLNMSPVRAPYSNPEQLQALISEWKEQGLVDSEAVSDQNPLGFLVHDDVPNVISAGYRFVAQHEAVSTVLIGTGNVDHLEESVAHVLRPAARCR